MVVINTCLSLWVQFGSFAFLLGGVFSDLLVIRFFLSVAYIFLLLNGILGSPLWPKVIWPGHIQLDVILWAIVNIYVHASNFVQLLMDERKVVLKNEDLWRLFYRIGGLSQKMFLETIDPYCEMVTFSRNQDIPIDFDASDAKCDARHRKWFYVIYKGRVRLTVATLKRGSVHRNDELHRTTRTARSGQIFDFQSLGFLADAVYQKARLENYNEPPPKLFKSRLVSAKALSDEVVVFRFPGALMASKIACHPTTRMMWKELLMENLLRIVQPHFDGRQQDEESESAKINSFNDNKSYESFIDFVSEEVNPLFLPLQEWEEPHHLIAGSGQALMRPLRHLWQSMVWSYTPPWPLIEYLPGLRHSQLMMHASQTKRPDQQYPHHQADDTEINNNNIKLTEQHPAEKNIINTSGQTAQLSDGTLPFSSINISEQSRPAPRYVNPISGGDEEHGLVGLNVSFVSR